MSQLLEHASSALPQQLTYRHFLVGVSLYVSGFFVVDLVRKPRIPSALPTVGGGSGLFSTLQTLVAGIKHTHAWIQEGYAVYSKKGKSFVLPSDISSQAAIVVPLNQMQWFLEQPDSVLSARAAHYDSLYGDYSFITPRLLRDPYHEHVIHRAMARNLNALIPEIEDEVRHCVDEVLGTDTENWKSVDVWEMLQKIVSKLSNRMFVGPSLCRNEDFLAHMAAFANDVIRNMILLTFVPRALKPLVGPVLGLVNKYHFRGAAKHTLPLIRARLVAIERKDAGDPEYVDWHEPNDFITWTIRLASAEGRADELEPVRIAQRLMPINFAAIHTTVTTAHGALLDIVAADPVRGFVDGLREEARRVYDEEGCRWTKSGLGRLYRMDSAIRETMRFSIFTQTLMSRKVVSPGGVTNKAEGWHVPQGVLLTLPVTAASFDHDVFDCPDEFDAFRHSRRREAFEARPAGEKGADEGLKLKQRSMVTTGESHLAFSHGRHACPGRFFVAHELKMLLAYMFLNYDIKPLPSRPPSKWIGRNNVPPMDACIEFRRKPDTVAH